MSFILGREVWSMCILISLKGVWPRNVLMSVREVYHIEEGVVWVSFDLTERRGLGVFWSQGGRRGVS